MSASMEGVNGGNRHRTLGNGHDNGNGHGNGDGDVSGDRASLYGVHIDRGQSIGVLRGSAGPVPAVEPNRTHRFCLEQHPQFLLTYSDDMPQKIKLRKRFRTFWPLVFTFRADYCRRLRAFQYGFSCKDMLLKGRLHVDLQNQRLEYRKLISAGNGTALALNAQCSIAGLATAGQQAPLRPMIGVQWMIGGSGTARWARDGKFDLRKKFRITRNLGLEACGTAELPLPRAQYAMHEDESRFSFGGDDDNPFHLHLDQLNIRLEI